MTRHHHQCAAPHDGRFVGGDEFVEFIDGLLKAHFAEALESRVSQTLVVEAREFGEARRGGGVVPQAGETRGSGADVAIFFIKQINHRCEVAVRFRVADARGFDECVERALACGGFERVDRALRARCVSNSAERLIFFRNVRREVCAFGVWFWHRARSARSTGHRIEQAAQFGGAAAFADQLDPRAGAVAGDGAVLEHGGEDGAGINRVDGVERVFELRLVAFDFPRAAQDRLAPRLGEVVDGLPRGEVEPRVGRIFDFRFSIFVWNGGIEDEFGALCGRDARQRAQGFEADAGVWILS